MSDVNSYQCILSVKGLETPCLFYSVLGSPCRSTDSTCNRLKSWVGSDWEAKKIFYLWNYNYISINKVKWRWGPNVWNSVCWTYNHQTSKLKAFVNHQTVELTVASLHYGPRANMEIFFMNSKAWNNIDSGKNSFHGALTDIQMWNRSLTWSEMSGWADCAESAESGGDLIDWRTAELSITGLIRLTAERDSTVCGRNENKKIVRAFNRRLDLYHSVRFCNNFGEISSAWEETEREEMVLSLEALERKTCRTDLLPAGIMWSEAAKGWTEVNTGRRLKVEKWFQGRPSNNTETDNCLVLLSHDQTFYDTSCGLSELCPVCRLTKVRPGGFISINLILLSLLRIYN